MTTLRFLTGGLAGAGMARGLLSTPATGRQAPGFGVAVLGLGARAAASLRTALPVARAVPKGTWARALACRAVMRANAARWAAV